MDSLAQAQIELNKLYGKRLIIVAWIIEIVAASIGLALGIISATSSSAYYEEVQAAGNLIGSAGANTFVGAAPFIIIAAVELTKIPLALGFYRVRRMGWRLTFLITLLFLIFVTFETIFSGLERNFSGTEAKIKEPKTQIIETKAILANKQRILVDIDERTIEQIDSDFSLSISDEEKKRENQINSLINERNEEIQSIQSTIDNIINRNQLAGDEAGEQKKVDSLRKDIQQAQNQANDEKKSEREEVYSRINDIELRIQDIDDNMTLELQNKGLLQSASSIRAAAELRKEPLLSEKAKLITGLEEVIEGIDSEIEEYIRSRREDLNKAEDSLSLAQTRDKGYIQERIKTLENRTDDKSRQYNARIDESNILFDKRIEDLEGQREDLKLIQKNRESRKPDIEIEIDDLNEEIIKLDRDINEAADQNPLYRIAIRVANWFQDDGKEVRNYSEIPPEILSATINIWFGSISLIAAITGVILAMAGFVLQDPEAYKPIVNKKRPLLRAVRGVLLRLRIFYKTRRTGVLRRTFRALLVDIRKWFRAPKIKFKEVKVPHEVIKEVQVPGPEKIIYKEVPKEIIKSEIVYVPLYSVEEGTLLSEKDKYKTPKLDDE